MSAGYCPLDVNTGIIELIAPIQQVDLKSIENRSSPFSISFAPRTTIPSMVGNRIDETSGENTLTLKGNRFSLVDVQICSPLNKGYLLPNLRNESVAELVLSFSPKSVPSSLSELAGVLLCIPIYDNGVSSHNQYLSQLINANAPSCKYTNIPGSEYNGGDYQTIQNSSLSECINSCCNDPQCMAYTYNSGACYLKNSIPNLIKTGNDSTISGTVNHTIPGSTYQQDTQQEKRVANLQTIFYDKENDSTQVSICYRTCFETFANNSNIPTSSSIFVAVFPNGIQLNQQDFQNLVLQLGGSLKPFMCPPALRNAQYTLTSYRFDDSGQKIPLSISSDGLMYRTPISCGSNDFRERFEYFTLPPKLPNNKFDPNVCPYYKTEQYKCVPFNQLADLSGDYVIPGNVSLHSILQKQNEQLASEIKKPHVSASSNQVEEIIVSVAGVGAAILAFVAIGSWVSKNM